MIECVWLSLVNPPSQIDVLQWVWVLGSQCHCGGSCCEGFYVALKHSLYTIDDLKPIGQINANLLHSVDEINPSSVKPLLLVPLPLSCSQLVNVCKHDRDKQLGHIYEPLSWT